MALGGGLEHLGVALAQPLGRRGEHGVVGLGRTALDSFGEVHQRHLKHVGLPPQLSTWGCHLS